MADESFRIDGLDFLRGCAVMGILLANIVVFALPSAALFNPFTIGTIGTNGSVDLAAWLFNFLFVDGKMRALFALLFGASILLVMESAEMDGRDGVAAHRRRMLWLIPIGLAHYLLLWSGDILLQLALCGLVATLFVRLETLSLIKLALALLGAQWLINLSATLPGFWLRSAAQTPGATQAQWASYADALGIGQSASVASELAHYRQGYDEILAFRLAGAPHEFLNLLLYSVPEMLAFIALGMAMLKGGFLAGQWQPAQYGATWRRALVVGLVPMAGLALWVLISRDPLAAQAASFGWSVPLRLPLAVGLAALAMGIAVRLPDAWLTRAIRAIGRLALSNYLLTSLVMTGLFYGYGLALFGTLGRAMLLVPVIGMWAIMIGWSMMWRRRMGQGPAERLWRRLARGST